MNHQLLLILGLALVLSISCSKDDEITSAEKNQKETQTQGANTNNTNSSTTETSTTTTTTTSTTTTETTSTTTEITPDGQDHTSTQSSYANKTIWVYGVSGPSFKEHPEEWVVTDYSEHLPWKEEYGWYDCNKIATGGTDYRDNNLCWAASASNMLHWWIVQNKKYIDQYMALNSTSNFVKSYPHTYPKRQTLSKIDSKGRSDIFALFTERWHDEGGYTNDGINWFISGWKPKRSATLTKGEQSQGGYFSEIFPATNEYDGSSKSIAYAESGISKKRLDQILKDAFENKKAIGFSYPGHAMTIWGAEFDENGEIDYIYYANNNYGEKDENMNGGALIRAKVLVKDTYFVGYVSNKNYPDRPTTISKLVLLPLHQEKWKAFLNGK